MAEYDAQPGRTTPAQSDLSQAQLEADEIDLYTGLRGVAGLVAGARGVIDLLGDVAEFAAKAIPGVDGAGVALIQPNDHTPSIQTWAATAESLRSMTAFLAPRTKDLKLRPAIRGFWDTEGGPRTDISRVLSG